MRGYCIVLAGAMVCSSLAARAPAGDKTNLPLDKEFLLKVATCNNAEIEISKLASSRSDSSDVKDYAAMVIKDHESAGNKLAALLKDQKLAIAAGFDKETKDEVSRLGKLKGESFDAAFLHCMVKAHKDAINLFENEIKNGREEDIRSFAKNILPDLQKHLSRAQTLDKSAK